LGLSFFTSTLFSNKSVDFLLAEMLPSLEPEGAEAVAGDFADV
jgi:hypothetical protein